MPSSLQSEYLLRARNELTEHIVYGNLARREKNPENRALLEKLSVQEKQHAEFWQTLLPADAKATAHSFAVHWIPLLRAVFGVTFTVKFLETHEQAAIATYQKMLADPAFPAAHRARLEAIIKDEQSHERALFDRLKEKRVAYIGFIALGLADAIVEITGVHAGFLGVTGQTLIAGISGIIVGFAAAISMGSASYIQAKQDAGAGASAVGAAGGDAGAGGRLSPIISGLATGVSYLCSVILLATPYFLLTAMLPAFIVSTAVGVALLAAFTFYGAVIFDRAFAREFIESVSLMLGTALATYLLGTFVGRVFHVSERSF